MSSTPPEQRSGSNEGDSHTNSKDDSQPPSKKAASPKRSREPKFKRPGFGPKYPPLSDEHGKEPLDSPALERYRALDTLAAALFQTGLAVFVGGVAIAFTVHSLTYRIILICASIPPFCAGCTAGFAMLDIAHEDPESPTFYDLRAKRSSVESSGFWQISSILVALALLVFVLAITNKLNASKSSAQSNIPSLYRPTPAAKNRLTSPPTKTTVCEACSKGERIAHTTKMVPTGKRTTQQVPYHGVRIRRDGSSRAKC